MELETLYNVATVVQFVIISFEKFNFQSFLYRVFGRIKFIRFIQ